ncbi:MAG: cellulase family glycosylhydrolase [Fimbriimonadaceae bacterium]|nr:cellulase family glycosylhydrolase [Fimbriimonadaceae bacterium]
MRLGSGFNVQWIFHHTPGRPAAEVDRRMLDWIARRGFNFVRVASSYRYWTRDFDYLNPDLAFFDWVDGCLAECRMRGIHLCFNIHRAPGYCINEDRNSPERHILWTDAPAQDGFAHQWAALAERYRGVPAADLSFDLLNEPPELGRDGFTEDIPEALMRRVIAGIRAADPDRPIILDGIAGGHIAIPELADAADVHSTRGYMPMTLSHQGAGWWTGWKEWPEPVWPGALFDGRTWDRAALRDYYEPWRAVQAAGTAVHVGEFGCYNQVDNDTALAWFKDLLGVFQEFGWNYGLWGFEGAFGIVKHGRPGAVYEDLDGYEVDRALLDLLLEHRTEV